MPGALLSAYAMKPGTLFLYSAGTAPVHVAQVTPR